MGKLFDNFVQIEESTSRIKCNHKRASTDKSNKIQKVGVPLLIIVQRRIERDVVIELHGCYYR